MRTMMAFGSMALASALAAGCGPGTAGRETPLEHAQASSALQQKMATLAAAGWSVTDLAQATVDQYDASAAAEGEPTSATWTRVRVSVSRAADSGSPLEAELVLAWPEGGADVFALAPKGQAATDQLLADLDGQEPAAEVDWGAAGASGDGLGTTSAAASCGGLGYARSNCSQAACCRGLSCANYAYYSSCICRNTVTVTFPSRFTVSTACFALVGNPLGAAWYRRNWKGCADGGVWNLTSDACGRTRSVPAYTISNSDVFVCGQYNC